MDDYALGRELGAINTRLDTHDAAYKRIENQQVEGFAGINVKLDGLIAERNARRGLTGFIKVIAGSGALAGAFEGALHLLRGKGAG